MIQFLRGVTESARIALIASHDLRLEAVRENELTLASSKGRTEHRCDCEGIVQLSSNRVDIFNTPGLPGKKAPRTAAKAMKEIILKHLENRVDGLHVI